MLKVGISLIFDYISFSNRVKIIFLHLKKKKKKDIKALHVNKKILLLDFFFPLLAIHSLDNNVHENPIHLG